MATLQLIEPSSHSASCTQSFLENLSAESARSLDRLTAEAGFPAEAALFVEGQRSQGIMVIVSGRVKLSTTSAEGRTLVVRIAGPGEILGLSATVMGRSYELTAETVERCQIKIVPREAFMRWLRSNPESAYGVAEELAAEYNSTCQQLRSMLLSHTATERLARMLLELSGRSTPAEGAVRVSMALTHQEMAEMIGTSRETVTRLLAGFRRKRILEIEGSMLVLLNRSALQEMARGDGIRYGS